MHCVVSKRNVVRPRLAFGGAHEWVARRDRSQAKLARRAERERGDGRVRSKV